MVNQSICSIGNNHSSILRRTLFSVLTMVIIITMGCATVGREFPVSRVSDIEVNMTTRDEIRTMFGAPWRVGIENGEETWTYGKYHYSAFKETSTRDLVVRFNDKGIVTSYTFNTTNHEQ